MTDQTTQTSSFNRELLSTLNENGLVQDRLPGDILILPNDMQDIRVSVNDFVVSETINYSLDKLYYNWLYLISSSVIPSNNIPNADYYTSIVIDTPSTGLNWTSSSNFPSLSSTSTNRSLNGIKKLTKLVNTVDKNNYNLIATTSTNIILLSGTGESGVDVIVNSQNPLDIIRSDSSITHPSNNINFLSISDHVINTSNELFVLDDTLKSIFKFDISGMLTLDKAILNNDTPGRLMTGMIGSPGDVSEKNRFFNPTSMVSVDDLIYVLDFHPQQGTVVKQFDSQLNWKRNYNLGLSLSAGPIDIEYNIGTNGFYVLCHTTAYGGQPTEPLLVEFDHLFNHIQTTPLMDKSKHDVNIMLENFRSINFSIENPNIMYIVTSKNIYKKYLTRATDFIGRFRLGEKYIGTGDNSDMNFQSISISESIIQIGDETKQKDQILLYESTYEVIHKFQEDSNYEQSIETMFDDKVIHSDELYIKPEESVSTFVYNKTLMKHLYNNILVLENTSRKFSTTYDSTGISQYVGFKYLNQTELSSLNYNPTMSNYIGVNETVTTHTINRCLEQIYNLQLRLLSNMQEKPTNVYPLVNVPIILSVQENI